MPAHTLLSKVIDVQPHETSMSPLSLISLPLPPLNPPLTPVSLLPALSLCPEQKSMEMNSASIWVLISTLCLKFTPVLVVLVVVVLMMMEEKEEEVEEEVEV